MKPLEDIHLLGRERYYCPERSMEALGNCAFRLESLLIDTCACTPTCELREEDKEILERMFSEKTGYRNWHPKECANYVMELIKEVERNKNIVTTRGVVNELNISSKKVGLRELAQAVNSLKRKLRSRIIDTAHVRDENFWRIKKGLACVRDHFKLSQVDYELLCTAINLAEETEGRIGILTNDGGLLKAVEDYNLSSEGLAHRYFFGTGREIRAYTFLSDRGNTSN